MEAELDKRMVVYCEVFFYLVFALSSCVSLAGINIGLGGVTLFLLARMIRGRWKPGAPQMAMLAFFLWNTIAGLMSPLGPSVAMNVTKYWSWTAFIAASALPKKVRRYDWLFLMMLASSLTTSMLMSFFEMVSGYDWPSHAFQGGGNPPTGFFSHHVILGGAVCLSTIFLAARSVYGHDRPLPRWEYTVGGTFGAIELVISMARGYWLAMVGGALAVASGRGRRWVVSGAIAGALLAACLLFLGPASIQNRFREMFDMSNPSVAERFYLWIAGLHTWQAHPIAGWGPGTYQMVAEPFKDPYRNLIHYPTFTGFMTTCHAHNHYIMILISSGIIGLLLFFLLIYLIARAIFKQVDPSLKYGGLAVLACFLIGGFFDYNGGDAVISTVNFFLLGLAAQSVGASE